jgi:transaldolase/glucose-6-phosphate isomerase
MHEQVASINRFAREIRREGIHHVVLLGMGGSSLAAEVFQATQGTRKGYPELIVLDSTHPDAVRAVEEKIDLHQTLFIVSSKSGGTIETLSFFQYFWEKYQALGEAPGRSFIAITDPGTSLEALARKRGFRKVFLAPEDVGGRFSALAVFGLVPAALIGADIHLILDGSWAMMDSSVAHASGSENPALVLGATLGELARAGRDKLTIITSSSLAAFPAWIEQLVAESTGKDGKGIVPIVDEPLGDPDFYGADRNFVEIHLVGDAPVDQDGLAALERAGHPVTWLQVQDPALIGQEFFRWEVATAAAGSILGVQPFNEPDVTLAKEFAKKVIAERSSGQAAAGGVPSIGVEQTDELSSALRAWLASAGDGDYIAVAAYLPHDDATHDALQSIRLALRERTRLATTLGYGPRLLHSTGQLHKGGPNNGLFLQIIDEPADPKPVPESDYSFGDLIRAQALGDALALRERGRRVLRVNLGGRGAEGLSELLGVVRAG